MRSWYVNLTRFDASQRIQGAIEHMNTDQYQGLLIVFCTRSTNTKPTVLLSIPAPELAGLLGEWRSAARLHRQQGLSKRRMDRGSWGCERPNPITILPGVAPAVRRIAMWCD